MNNIKSYVCDNSGSTAVSIIGVIMSIFGFITMIISDSFILGLAFFLLGLAIFGFAIYNTVLISRSFKACMNEFKAAERCA